MTPTPSYLWFAPNAGLWPSFRLEHRLANALSGAGRRVTMVNCDGVLNEFCPVMTASGLRPSSPSPEKRRCCRECKFNRDVARERATYGSLNLDAYVTKEIKDRARHLTADVTSANWMEFTFDGIPVGRYAAYLTMLNVKVADVSATEDSWREYQSDLYDSLLALLAAPAMLDDVAPSHLVVYNPLYPVNRMVTELAGRCGIQLVAITAGSFVPARYETVGIYPHLFSGQTLTDSPVIVGSLDLPCSPDEVRAVGRHIRALVTGADPWVYSVAPSRRSVHDIRALLGVRPDSRVAVVLVSSPDETRASERVDAEYVRDEVGGYSNISEFLAAGLLAARACPEIDFVFRLHPRLFPNARESVTSPDLQQMLAVFDGMPANVVLNTAADGLSLYDVMKVADCGVNQSSSSGLEFMALGRPVVQFDPARQGAYPPRLGLCVERAEASGLATAIRTAIDSPAGLEISRYAFRWYAIALLRVLLHLQPIIAETTPAPRPVVAPAISRRRSWRSLIPRSWRERGARHLDRRTRPESLQVTGYEWWHDEFIERIDSATGGPIWLPPVIRRGDGGLADETSALIDELRGLRSEIGLDEVSREVRE